MTIAPVVRKDTGEVLSPDDLAGRVCQIADDLERANRLLKRLYTELGKVTVEYDRVYRRGYRTSDGRSEKDRAIDAEYACETTETPAAAMPAEWPTGSPTDLAAVKTLLEASIKRIEKTAHTDRAVLSAFQTASANIRAVYGAT